jgi:phosphatidylinositol glycan class B
MPHPFLVALGFRSLSLLLPHTFFQPDEFYQAFEPGYAAVFGEGYLTWEWRDLPSLGPAAGSGLGRWWDEVVVRGRLRGYIWPGVFALVYGLIQRLGIDSGESIVRLGRWLLTLTFVQTFAPRVVGVVLAAATDYYTAALAGKILGRRSGCTAVSLSGVEGRVGPSTIVNSLALCATGILRIVGDRSFASLPDSLTDWQLFLSLTSLFNAHLLPRALSTSPETLLTVAAVYYYPIGGEATERNAESAAVVPVAGEKAKDNAEEKGASKAVGASSSNGASANPEINAAFNHNYSLMDRVDDEHSDT